MAIQKDLKLLQVTAEVVLLPDDKENPGNNQQNNQNDQQQTVTKYDVTFRVTNTTNQGLSNVEITLTDTSDSTNVETGTTSNGDVTISVKPGTYSVTAVRDGYTAPATIENVVVTDSNVTVSDAIVMTSE